MRTVLLVCFLTLFSLGSTFAQYQTSRQKVNFLLKVTRVYAPDAYQILSSEEDYRELAQFAAEGEDWVSQLASLNTVVHEICHGYQHEMGGWNEAGFY